MIRIWSLVAGNPWLVVAVLVALSGSHTYVYVAGKDRANDTAAKVQLQAERVATKSLLEANAKAAMSNARFAKIQQDVEIKQYENQLAIDAARKQLAATKRLRDPGYRPTDCRGLPKNTAAPSDTTNTTTPSELSDEFTTFLREQAYAADQVSIYAKACHEWATGIQ